MLVQLYLTRNGPDMMTFATVVLSNTTRSFDKKYTYAIPDNLASSIFVGSRVLVPFGGGNQSREGFVVELTNAVPDADIDFKHITSVMEPYPLIKRESIELMEWMKKQYICTYSDVIKCMLPPGISVCAVKCIKLIECDCSDIKKPNCKKIVEKLRDIGGECDFEELKLECGITGFKKYTDELQSLGVVDICESYQQKITAKTIKGITLNISPEEVTELLESNAIKKIQHIRVLEILKDNEEVSVSDIQRFADVTPSVLNTLSKYGYIRFTTIEVKRNPLSGRHYETTVPLEPTDEQRNALESLRDSISRGCYSESLLHGVTGSGKTEVYLQLIAHCFSLGRRAIMLVPEISLTPQMVERFVARFGNRVAIIHSRLSLGERYDQWRLISEGKVDVVVGARSAVFAPLQNLGLIIIDEEHESSYKSEAMPRYNAKEVAQKRCEINNSLLLYGSATPSIETYYRAVNGEIQLLEMQKRPSTAVLPKVHLVDMRQELENGNKTPFCKMLVDELEKNIENGEQSILFLNRRGFSTFVMCRSCGLTMKCPECSIALTYHSKDERLICHYCGYTVNNPSRCPKCNSNYIRYFGTGTQKIEEEIKKTLPQSSVIRMDIDTTGYKNSHEDILTRFRRDNINILVGTQMIAKGHDFPNVTLVGVLAADSMLNAGDFRSAERTFQLLTQVAGRAGRGELPGRVVIQTYNTEEYSILAACRHDFKKLYQQEISIRKKLWYPPFSNVAIITFTGTWDKKVYDAAKAQKPLLVSAINAPGQECSILGPSRSPIQKIANKYRWRIVIKLSDKQALIEVLTKLNDSFQRKKVKDVNMSIDINPYNML